MKQITRRGTFLIYVRVTLASSLTGTNLDKDFPQSTFALRSQSAGVSRFVPTKQTILASSSYCGRQNPIELLLAQDIQAVNNDSLLETSNSEDA